ncbi:YodC family protein [Beijerinckia indica]|uniref:DUF2158 domain-containing protein n=1 Tax=Beijerinckia indica subsp. indica (strain ATCC 9039 / DSM 1715 / NCIMB 8712) TaxID=395963 RepID=B2IB18_BEII9|nr:DUF2158 domain-containing protein [Beijerinckia indica]ACB93718.1 conserved hypothetical protein [Beijerinckia indica subsp. indica ATCC 9039]
MSFEAGDIVQLKSGGPAMTVSGSSAEGIHCLWFAEISGEVKSAVIPPICLELIVLDDDEDLDDEEIEDDEPLPISSGRRRRQ